MTTSRELCSTVHQEKVHPEKSQVAQVFASAAAAPQAAWGQQASAVVGTTAAAARGRLAAASEPATATFDV